MFNMFNTEKLQENTLKFIDNGNSFVLKEISKKDVIDENDINFYEKNKNLPVMENGEIKNENISNALNVIQPNIILKNIEEKSEVETKTEEKPEENSLAESKTEEKPEENSVAESKTEEKTEAELKNEENSEEKPEAESKNEEKIVNDEMDVENREPKETTKNIEQDIADSKGGKKKNKRTLKGGKRQNKVTRKVRFNISKRVKKQKKNTTRK